MSGQVAVSIRRFVVDTFLFGDEAGLPSDEASLLREGLIDSTDVLELVAFLESEFDIQVGDEEIVPVNFDSVAGLARYVSAKELTSQPEAITRPSV
jgi:acyl carrier protein